MTALPSLDQYDLAAFLASICLVIFGYVVYPTHLVQVTVWLTIGTISIAWMGMFLHKLLFDTEW